MRPFAQTRDRTHQQPQSGIGMDTRKSWLCGCKSHAGKYRGAVPWKCLECVAKGAK
jgi:hypothetical protein